MNHPARRLRSSSVRAALIGVSAFALASCDEPVDLSFFETVDQCRAEAETSAEFDAGDCEDAFEMARREHAVAAPRYDELALCEEEHGEDACGTTEEAGGVADPAVASAGPTFMPFFMGYMIGNMMRGGQPGFVGRSLYADRQGALHTTTGQRMGFSGPGSTARATPAAVRPPAVARVAAPMSRATVSARGGFGTGRAASLGG